MVRTIKRRLQHYRPYIMAREMKRLLLGNAEEIKRQKVVSLAARGKFRGNALLSYIIDGFLLKPGQPVPTTHTNIWVSLEMARILRDLGYNVDAISYHNNSFIPRKTYSLFIDVRDNLERLSPYLGERCIKIMYLDTKDLLHLNFGEIKRLIDLQKRKGVTLRPRRVQFTNQGMEHANCGTSIGDRFTIETFQYARKPIYTLPIPASVNLPWPATKNFDKVRNRFLWFGSAGMVQKGLDLVLDAFAEMPDEHLTVCGRVQDEEDFVELYQRELYETSNIHTVGWVDVHSPQFTEIVNSCVGTILFSCSEGGSASTINCMHAGLIPILSYETRMDVEEIGFVLKTSSIAEIKECVRRVAQLPTPELYERSRKAWQYARENHTREKFTEVFRRTIEEVITLYGL